MAIRSVFVSKTTYPFFEEILVTFPYFSGFALSQKRKCQIGLHQNFLAKYRDQKVLEISAASLMSLGSRLSAMNLTKRTSQGLTTVESAFQSSKVFSNGTVSAGPFPEYLLLPGKECRKLVKQASNGLFARRYEFDGMTFYAPEFHISLFYDYLYLNALLEPENEEVSNQLLKDGYLAFSDLATSKAKNCQSRSAAIYVGLVRAGLIDQVKDYGMYLELFRTAEDGKPTSPKAYENVQLLYRDRVQLLSPIVPCTVEKEEVELYYAEHCSMLTNKKEKDNYLDLR